jgi:hypothetical protein
MSLFDKVHEVNGNSGTHVLQNFRRISSTFASEINAEGLVPI